jgi:hypothetical protein
MLRDDLKATPEVWDRVWGAGDARLASSRLDIERRSKRWHLFKEHVDEKARGRTLRCVELGAGEGDFSVLLAQSGHFVTLVDFSSTAITRAMARFESLQLHAQFIQSDLFQFAESAKGQFDASVSLGLAEHFGGPWRERVFLAHRQVLACSGTALISVPNAYCWPYRSWMSVARLRGTWPYGYEEPYSASEMRRLAATVGFARSATYKTGFAASLDRCILRHVTGRAHGWEDGPKWLNSMWGWILNLIADMP